MNGTVKILGGFIAGAALGTIAGILIAPDRGSNTLKKVKDESKRLSDGITESVTHAVHALTNSYGKRAGEKKEYENGELERRSSVGV